MAKFWWQEQVEAGSQDGGHSIHWLISQLYIVLWATAAVVLVVGLVRMLRRTIIGKGEFSQLLLYVATLATVAAYLTPQFDDAIHYCARLIFVAEVLVLIFEWRKRRK